jgi:O-antigen/teichoic acid export membrane protein
MKNQEKIGLVLIYVQFLVNLLVGFLFTPILINSIGLDQYGLYILVISLVGYLTIFDLGLNATVLRFVARYRINNDSLNLSRFLGTILFLYLFIVSFVLIIGLIIFNNLSLLVNDYFLYKITIDTLFIYSLINVCLSLPLGVFPSIIEGYGLFSITKSVRIIHIILRTLFLSILLLYSPTYGILDVIFFDTFFNFMFSLYYFFYSILKLKLNISFKNINLIFVRDIVSFSFFIFILAIVNQFFWKFGQIILGYYNSFVEIAVFGIAILLINYVIEITTSVSQILLPRITLYVNPFNKDKLSEIFIYVGKFQFFILSLIFIGFYFVGNDFIILWLGNDFVIVYDYVLLLIFSISLQTILTVGTSILKAINLHNFQAYIYLFSSIIFIFLSIFLSSSIDGYGLIISLIISIFFIQSFSMIFLFKEKLKLDIFTILKSILIPFFIPIVGLLISSFFFVFFREVNWISLLIKVIYITFFYSILVYLFSITTKEKAFFFSRVFKRDKI